MKRLGILVGILIAAIGCKTDNSLRDSIIISVSYEVDTLDPHARARLANYAIGFNMYESLVTTDTNMRIRPGLATHWENPDAYTWVFHLNPNVRFHDGTRLTSEDVVYSFRRLMTDSTLEAASQLANVSEVTAVDEKTVRIRTHRPLTIFLNKLFFVIIVPRGSTSETLTGKVNGTGPYRLQKWTQGQDLEMVRNEEYWGAKPVIKKVVFRLNRNPNQALNDMVTGKSQFIQCNSKRVEEIVSQETHSVLVHDSLFLKYLSYDLDREVTPYCSAKTNPFRNPVVRRAIHTALNRKAMAADLPSYAIPATQLIPPFVFGYNPQIRLQDYRPEAAKKLLAEAGYPGGFDVTMHARNLLSSTAEMVRSQLADVGIRVKLRMLPDSEFFNALNAKDFSFFLSRIGATIGDASDILDGAMHSRDLANHYGALNYGGYSNPLVDRVTEESAGIQQIDDRRSTLEDLMAVLMTDLPWIPLYVDQDVYAIDRAYLWHPRLDSHILAAEIELR